MLLHNLKVAVRNLLKYKTQSVISILGLAVGFVCFALANLWTRYEMTYDTHLEGNNRRMLTPTSKAVSIPIPLQHSMVTWSLTRASRCR